MAGVVIITVLLAMIIIERYIVKLTDLQSLTPTDNKDN
jgi:hypothetical protein